MNDKIKEIYDGMNDSERHGIQFGMFPARLQGLTHEEICELMEYRKSTEKQDVNREAK
jgi:hypothetical protein